MYEVLVLPFCDECKVFIELNYLFSDVSFILVGQIFLLQLGSKENGKLIFLSNLKFKLNVFNFIGYIYSSSVNNIIQKRNNILYLVFT